MPLTTILNLAADGPQRRRQLRVEEVLNFVYHWTISTPKMEQVNEQPLAGISSVLI